MAKILIVDDDRDLSEACQLFLEREGHVVSAAFNRAEGMEAVKSVDPDLLILDVMMEQPDDGFAMAQELRRNKFNKPILMLTSIAKVAGMDFGRDNDLVPVDDFQEKPIEPAKLLAKVRELLKKKEG